MGAGIYVCYWTCAGLSDIALAILVGDVSVVTLAMIVRLSAIVRATLVCGMLGNRCRLYIISGALSAAFRSSCECSYTAPVLLV